MTAPANNHYDPSCQLSWADVAVDSPQCPEVMSARIKQSKTDPLRQGIKLFIGKDSLGHLPRQTNAELLGGEGPSKGPFLMHISRWHVPDPAMT